MVIGLEACAVIVTRGDVSLDEPVAALHAAGLPVTVWNNGADERDDLSVYGRYAAIQTVTAPVIFVQDDDCVLPPESIAALLAAYQPGHVVCNMPARFREHYPDSALVGFGAVFDRELPVQAFGNFLRHGGEDVRRKGWQSDIFQRTCDVVFTTLTPRILVDVPVEILPCAHDAHRMWKQPGHFGERVRMLALARQVRDAVTA